MASAPQSAPAAAPDTLTGVLERIVFLNEENHYTIGELKPEADGTGAVAGAVTIIGALPGVQCGETLELRGNWVTHREHGRQFKIVTFRSTLPASVYGIRKYLGSGLVPGIGKTYAEKIVAKFGEQTLQVISTQSARLREVPGIGDQRAKAIKKAWDDQSALRDIMVFLQTYGVTTGQCLRLLKTYGTFARLILETEPYKVAREIDGIGFRTADKIARNLGLPTEGAARLEAGILHALGELEEEGHTALPAAKLAEHAAAMLEVPDDKIAATLARLATERQLLPHRDANGTDWLQSPPQARAEEEIAACVDRLLSHPGSFPPIHIDRAVSWAQDKAGFAFAPAQAEAVRAALANKFSILTGGPGTGKTTILSALCAILTAKKTRIVLAAPTGRAAQRMSETTHLPASTIHRLLGYDAEQGRFAHDASHPIAADLLVVDESSMSDNRLAAALLRAVHAHTHLLLVGDVNQLPSVGPGNVLQDLIASRRLPVTTLNAVFRQGARSQIVLTAHDILQGRIELPVPFADPAALDPAAELQFLTATSPEHCVSQITALCQRHLPEKFHLDPLRDVQVLAPMHKGAAGTQSINAALQRALKNAAPARGIPAYAGLRFEEGDKVIQIRNNYDKGVFNGDLGCIREVRPEAGTFTVDFDGTVVDYDRADLGELQLAYAITIHKSQGSEFNTVIIPVLKTHFVMLQRNLIYTAITRGKKRVILVGDPAAYAIAVRNTDNARRLTLLPERLRSKN
ncbi:MAG: ATP-dependent RecD-like DNA helicase [Puniceicoccales bacterium]|jgi:exodeoxyribonuclease V alpha subunit|nr:ATP-dependent RecD-like DNA helicase [Puniceicoccales bacterium]